MNYELHQKAFMVGEEDAVFRFRMNGYNHPSDRVELIYADTPGKAKSVFCNYGDDYLSIYCARNKQMDLYKFEGRFLTKSAIYDIEKHREWRDKLSSFAESNPDLKVLIYSGQWGAFWRENCCGYTSNKEEAGIYTAKEAWGNVSHCGLEKMIELRVLNS